MSDETQEERYQREMEATFESYRKFAQLVDPKQIRAAIAQSSALFTVVGASEEETATLKENMRRATRDLDAYLHALETGEIPLYREGEEPRKDSGEDS